MQRCCQRDLQVLPTPGRRLPTLPACPPTRLSQVEGLKTRAMVRDLVQYMRSVNPELATALIGPGGRMGGRAGGCLLGVPLCVCGGGGGLSLMCLWS